MSGQPSRKKTRKVLERLASAMALATEVLAGYVQAELPEPEPNHIERASRARLEEWRTWDGFRGDMVHREREYLRHNQPPVTKRALAGHHGDGDGEKSIDRRMTDYGLNPKTDWPPSTWPELPQADTSGHGHLLAAMVAGVFLTEMIDYVSDGRLNHAIKFAWELCQRTHSFV